MRHAPVAGRAPFASRAPMHSRGRTADDVLPPLIRLASNGMLTADRCLRACRCMCPAV